MHKNINNYISSLNLQIEDSRISVLDQLVNFITQNQSPNLNFICTHNSRRSHLSQVWAQVIAHHFDVEVKTFSGGTEATAFHPNAIAALERAGFEITSNEGENPRYQISFSENVLPLICFSKVFDHASNPTTDFAAIMTCSEADNDCPFIAGASERIQLFFEDPKVSDGTPLETKVYDERCAQIASEMYYVFSKVK